MVDFNAQSGIARDKIALYVCYILERGKLCREGITGSYDTFVHIARETKTEVCRGRRPVLGLGEKDLLGATEVVGLPLHFLNDGLNAAHSSLIHLCKVNGDICLGGVL
ncbi:hypothetical protein SDC9_153757 [bioreactor metagenome]|uniref:Uncharacterized protein n=1 Tax=bioreactor metagenome TaxID=1076179 RepID=A0A645EWU9_9ZZZZ